MPPKKQSPISQLGEQVAEFGIPFADSLAAIKTAFDGTVYTILSDNFAGGKAGETVTSDDLEGCNIPALVEAGHITAQTTSEATSATNIKEQ